MSAEPETVEVRVRALASGGAGVADLPDGRVVFVPRTAPGDRAAIRVDKVKRRWAVGTLRRLVEPGPDRTEAPCALYAECGGCQLQHLPYERQLEWKGRFVADALGRLGGLDVPPPPVEPSPRTEGYRRRMSFTLRRLSGGRIVAGLHALGRPAHVVDVHDECLLPEPGVRDAWTRLRRSWGPGARHLPRGGRLRLTLRRAPAGVELLVEGGERGWDATALAEAQPSLSAVWHRAGSEGRGPARLLHGTPSPGGGAAFEQANEAAAEALRAHVVSVAGTGERAVEAYCGTGALARALVASGWSVTGIEVDEGAVAAARADAPVGLRIVAGRVEERLAGHLPAELLVLNPPRTGLDARVPEVMLAAPAARVVYVSCDPATLARDLRALSAAYELAGLRAFDLFPHTAHVECVAELRLREGGT